MMQTSNRTTANSGEPAPGLDCRVGLRPICLAVALGRRREAVVGLLHV